MSRITLHLRKQVREQDVDCRLSFKLPSTMPRSFAETRSRLRFAKSGVELNTGMEDVSVVVQESAIVHDDQGNVLRSYNDASDNKVINITGDKKDARMSEWIELRPPAPVRIQTRTNSRTGRSEDTDMTASATDFDEAQLD